MVDSSSKAFLETLPAVRSWDVHPHYLLVGVVPRIERDSSLVWILEEQLAVEGRKIVGAHCWHIAVVEGVEGSCPIGMAMVGKGEEGTIAVKGSLVSQEAVGMDGLDRH